MKKITKQLKLFIEFLIVYSLIIILYLLPINIVSNIGGYLFKLFGPFSKSHKIAIENYKRIFKNLNNNEIKKNIEKCWENLGRTIFELLILEKIIDKKNKKIRINGLENIKKAIEKNESVIFFSIHQSNWEILVPTIDKLGFRVGAIYRHINNNFINKLIINKRNRCIDKNKSFYTPKGKEGAKEIISAINNNSSLVVLVDQKDNAGENIKFFNINSKTQTAFLKIARKHKLNLIPVKNVRSDKYFNITFYPPIDPFKQDIKDSEAMLIVNKIIEKWIIENPTQWFWQHNRFS
tara:strand:+ start:1312 stop:2190 length:879 start_codon:yes stop_codon:yes gene_type:complete